MVPDIIRDAPFGQIVNYLSNGRLFPFADQRAGYVPPSRYLRGSNCDAVTVATSPSETPERTSSGDATLIDEPAECRSIEEENRARFDTHKKDRIDAEKQLQTGQHDSEKPYPWLVTFEKDDPDRPMNWSVSKRLFIAVETVLLTFCVYFGSSIYTPSVPGLIQHFGMSHVAAISGLTLYVAAYGISPMLLSPMQELPKLGRNPVYIVGLGLFVIFQVPQVAAQNLATILVFRFLSGFVGAPALATGGATMADIFSIKRLAIAMGAWSMGAVCAPTVAPVTGSFAAQAKGWRWPLLELLWLSAATFLLLFFAFPETLESTILVRRAERLRRLTGNQLLKAPAELEAVEGETLWRSIKVTTERAFRLFIEPALLACHIYIGIAYACYYLCTSGLAYLGFIVAAIPTYLFYIVYQLKYIQPRLERDPNLAPEVRLELGVMSGPLIPISLLIFGWTANRTHWIGPIFGAALYMPPIFLLFQSCLTYCAISYPRYAASVLAANDLFRSIFASLFPLFGEKFYRALGVGPGCTLLAGITAIMVPILYIIMKTGGRLRMRSRFAES